MDLYNDQPLKGGGVHYDIIPNLTTRKYVPIC